MAIEILTNEEGKEPQEKDYSWFNEQFEKSYIDLSKKPKQPEGVISIGKQTSIIGDEYPNYIMSKGEISVIKAASKKYKSTFKSHLAAVYFTGQSDEFSEIRGHRKDNESIIDIDTEQGAYYAWNTFYRTKKLCNYASLDGYFPFKIKQMPTQKRVEFLEMLLESRKVQKPALVFIDGIADLLTDTNDLSSSTEVFDNLLRLTDEYDIHICCIIHNNPGSSKARGHTGTKATDKSQTVIDIQETEDKSGIFHVTHQFSRGARFNDFYFMHDNKGKILYQVDSPDDIEPTENVPY